MLLSEIDLKIPRLESRENEVFYCPASRTNVLKKSLIYSIMHTYNYKLMNLLNINCDCSCYF